MKASVPCLVLLAASLLTGCGKQTSESTVSGDTASGDVAVAIPYTITTTVGMVNDIVQRVAGDRAEVSNIIGEGVDPHLYGATRNDVLALTNADVVFYNGLMLEGKLSDTLMKVGRTKPVYAVTEQIEPEYLVELADSPGHYDPHVWMDPNAWGKAVDAVEEALTEFDPAGQATYAANAAALRDEIARLDAYAREALATIPEQSRVMVTAHDAFSYFGRAYNLQVEGIQGLSTESEAGLKRIEKMVKMLVEREVGAVFIESTIPTKNIQALIEGAEKKGHAVRIGGELFSDAMGAPGTYEGTYIGMIDHNVTTVARALGGEAPEKGFQGKLSSQHD